MPCYGLSFEPLTSASACALDGLRRGVLALDAIATAAVRKAGIEGDKVVPAVSAKWLIHRMILLRNPGPVSGEKMPLLLSV